MKQPFPGNPIVFFDIQVGKEQVGRMVLELRKDVVPRTAENFRRLCVGDYVSQTTNKRLSYTGTRIHRVQRMFAICGGTIGKVGESIYGPTFPDENFQLLHEEGVVSMSNYGPDTNNSQFFITRTDCPNLDGTHVVCGRVLRGFEILLEMEKVATDEATTTELISIVEAGQLEADQPWNYNDLDDCLPPFPKDWTDAAEYTREGGGGSLPDRQLHLLEKIKSLGNNFYNDQDTVAALRKYKKVERYHQFFADAHANATDRTAWSSDKFVKLRLDNLLNMAACHLKLGQFRDVVSNCNEVLHNSPKQSKAFYRRGVAAIEMKDYDSALDDLKQAHALAPNDRHILQQFNRGKVLLLEYRETEKVASQKMFK